MQKRYLYALMGISIILVGGVFFVWSKRIQLEPPQNQIPKEEVVETPKTESLDITDWKIYQNKSLGFIVRYPATWFAEEFYDSGFGMPVDCHNLQRSKECPNFGVAFSPTSHDNLETSSVVFNTFSQSLNTSIKNDDLATENPSWQKTTAVGNEYYKNNAYFPIYGSCFTQASMPHVSLKGGVGFYFTTFYDVPRDMYVDAAEEFCSHEIPDLIFDTIVESFRPI